jgi:hypothetical protein
MIDYFALALGHGLMVIALLRLVMRDALDFDPLIASITAEDADRRKSASIAGRNQARRARQQAAAGDDLGADEPGPD